MQDGVRRSEFGRGVDRQLSSPDGKFKREGRDFEDADEELRELFPKRAKSDGSSSDTLSERLSPVVPIEYLLSK